MKYCNKKIFCIILTLLVFVNIILINFIIYKKIDLKKVDNYMQNDAHCMIHDLYKTDEAACFIEFTKEDGYVKSARITSFCKYLLTPEKVSETLNYDAAKWVLESESANQILYDAKYKEQIILDSNFAEIANGRCKWNGPRTNRKFYLPGILQTTIILKPRDVMEEIESYYSFQYTYEN